MFYLILFLTLFSTLFAQEEETSLLTPLATDPSALVEGGINIITGQPSIATEDLVIQGAEPIRIGRFLIEPDKWLIGVTTAEINSNDTKITISDKHGLRIIYREAGNERIGGKKFQRYVPSRKNRGFSNTYQGKISSQTNIKNNYVLLDKENRKDLTVHCADGTIQNYKRIRHHKNKFLLISEHLPNGNWLFYNYESGIESEKPGPLVSIFSRDPSQKRPLASAHFIYKGNHLQILGSDGQVLEYFFQEKDSSPFKSLQTVISPEDANKKTDYTYSEYTLTFDDGNDTTKDERRLGLIILSLKKFYEIDYYKEIKEIVAGQKIKIRDYVSSKGFFPDFRRNRVKTLSAPIGLNSKPQVTHSFIYPFKDYGYRAGEHYIMQLGSRFVYDIEGHHTEYHLVKREYFDYSDGLLSTISRYSNKEKHLNTEKFSWDSSTPFTQLLYKVFCNSDGTPVSGKHYSYDQQGNVRIEKFLGNLSGKGAVVFQGDQVVHEGVEAYCKRFDYFYCEPNLLSEEHHDSGLHISYRYLSGTNLPISHTTFDKDQKKSTKTFKYKENVLIREEMDDGISHTIKEITPAILPPPIPNVNFRPRQFNRGGRGRPCVPKTPESWVPPLLYDQRIPSAEEILPGEKIYIDLPRMVTEKYAVEDEERFLNTTVFHYGVGACVIQKDIYDANNQFCYSLKMKYDEKGRLISETNPLGQERISKFDDFGNLSYQKDFSGRVETTNKYDFSNRLYEKEIVGFDGIKRTYFYSYDNKHNLEYEIDERGHKTVYECDPLGYRTKTTFPPVPKEDGTLVSSDLAQIYDGVGNLVLQIDGDLYETKTTYNAYGKPLLVTHPDGKEDKYTYYLNGTLKSHTDPSGVSTNYVYDYLDRIVEKSVSLGEEILASETFQYTGNHLMSHIDAEKNQTIYGYDQAGRKISEEFGGEKTVYTYDSLGRVKTTQKGDLVTVSEYDFLNRVTEERSESPTKEIFRKIQYGYDAAGNRNLIVRFINGQETRETMEYDSLNRLIKKTDSGNHTETISYQDITNDHGQKVLQKTHTDPMGLQTIETYDVLNRIAKVEKKKETPLAISEKIHNKRGLLSLQIDTIFSPDGSSRQTRTRWEYNSRGRLETLIEAEGTLEVKTTTYTYTPRGELGRVTKPDGVQVLYGYNDLGQLETILSSDQTVNHKMSYNLLGHLQTSDDLIRTTDAKGRVKAETFPLGYTVLNHYDPAGRRDECEIPAANCLIEYGYNPTDMKSVTRKTLEGVELYSHEYRSHDLSGHLLEEQLIGPCGTVQYSIDSLLRRTGISAPLFTQRVLEFDPLGNIRKMRVLEDEITYDYDDLYQLTSESGLFAHSYLYDSLYNRLKKDSEPYQVNALNQVVSHFEYDKNGNPKRQNDTTYTYDALDRLIQITTPTQIQTFHYDSFHRCLSKTTIQNNHQETQYFLYDGQKEIGSFDKDHSLQELRILGHAPHAEIGAAISLELQGKIYAPIHDLQGNIAALLPIDASEPSYYRYSAFGEELTQGPTLSPWRFSCKRSDASTGLVYYGRRFYIPSLGRWLTPDPAGFTDGMNLYAFIHNDPLTHFDEYGLFLEQRSPVAFNSHTIMQNWGAQINQFSTGVNQGLVNSGYGALRFANTAMHAVASPFRSYDFKTNSFNFTIGDSYHSFNNWLDQKQKMTNNLFFSGGDPNNFAYKLGNFAGNFAGDMAMFGGAFRVAKGAASIGGRLYHAKWLGNTRKLASQTIIDTEQILFGQESIAKTFSNGDFRGMSINQVVNGLRDGTFSPNQLPINYLIKDGKMVTFNNRSLLTLRRAKLEPTVLKNVTGDSFFEEKLLDHLKGSAPSEIIRVRGGPPGTSWVGP